MRHLEAIDTHGSISSAARAIGLTYRAAWDAVQALNNLFDRPLIVSQTGGAAGGGASLTPRAAPYSHRDSDASRASSIAWSAHSTTTLPPTRTFPGNI